MNYLSLLDDPYLEILYREEWHSEDNQDYHRMWLEITPEYLYYTIIDDLNCQGTVLTQSLQPN